MVYLNMTRNEEDYRGWNIMIERKEDGAWYVVTRGQFRAEYGNFVGPACATQAAKDLVDCLLNSFDW